MSGDHMARTTVIDGDLYLNVSDFIKHLTVCAESVAAFCASAPGTSYVVDTLEQTVESLKELS